ncbi:MAG: hypothetical protein OXC57_00175 [Rhodobacteraceae bacterium]|nr:hypothetical protein [Paracoccaceae bacterium]
MRFTAPGAVMVSIPCLSSKTDLDSNPPILPDPEVSRHFEGILLPFTAIR